MKVFCILNALHLYNCQLSDFQALEFGWFKGKVFLLVGKMPLITVDNLPLVS
jgi:hypothetical protein